MPKLLCSCGHVTSLSGIPSPHEWFLVRDTDIPDAGLDPADLYATGRRVSMCASCGRLWFFAVAGGEPTVYARESGPPLTGSEGTDGP